VFPTNASNRAVEWVSSNKAIATVLDGKVIAMGAGGATITAKTANGKEASCSIQISAPGTAGSSPGAKQAVFVKGIHFSVSALKLKYNQTYGIKLTISPDNADNKSITFSSSDNSIATIDDSGNITSFGKSGTCVITAQAVGSAFATINITVDDASGVAGNGGNSNGFETTPTPSDNKGSAGYENTQTQDTVHISFPAVVPQEIDGSTAYAIPLTDAGNSDSVQYKGKCGDVNYIFSFKYARSAENEFMRVQNLLEIMRKQCNVYSGLTYTMEGSSYVPSHASSVGIPTELRDWINSHISAIDEMNNISNQVLNMIKYFVGFQPITEPTDEQLSQWISLMDEMINRFETDLWSTKIIKTVENIYIDCIVLRSIFTDPPSGGIVNYIYNHMDMLPDFSDLIAYIQKTYNPYVTLFSDLDHYHKLMYWTVTVSNDAGSPQRSFILRPCGHLFQGADDYTITVQASKCGTFGNVMHDQLATTIITLEAAE
jgi:hypothetical protein